ncbi:PKD domain-containing protein [Echinicola jeungdonensis]|uniref:PKD domain-containing protein n=1 Tax=Echinicola jeungdonensis TaxID=709343 RepID=A0ABV5J8A3_9BACT|nr:PKD domain-containing protein [Echinicola jeungdonensis]MDN3669500.1 PKD domain-containing protein [Echinicola jeungdonensis]
MRVKFNIILFLGMLMVMNLQAQEDRGYKIYQFPPDMIPRIDGKTEDWDEFPDEYVVGTDQLWDDSQTYTEIDPQNLDVKVKVAWVKGLNRLYFLYEAYDNYWDFSLPGLHNDTFEIVVDGDLSGGPLIDEQHPNQDLDWGARYFEFHGVHAQNYHIFTPAEGKDWALAWGSQPWIKELPYSNITYSYDFEPGEPGELIAEFWITPFDYAGHEGPERAVKSILKDHKKIGLTWAVIDYDDVNDTSKKGFWNLSKHHKMYGNSSLGTIFTLMPLDEKYLKSLVADWSFVIVDKSERLVAFRDQSRGEITEWQWDFGDGSTSTEQNPFHQYKNPGKYTVILNIKGPEGKARMANVWDVALE